MDGEIQCEWYALCDRPAIGKVGHPVLAAVPTCQRCLDAHALHDRLVDYWCEECGDWMSNTHDSPHP